MRPLTHSLWTFRGLCNGSQEQRDLQPSIPCPSTEASNQEHLLPTLQIELRRTFPSNKVKAIHVVIDESCIMRVNCLLTEEETARPDIYMLYIDFTSCKIALNSTTSNCCENHKTQLKNCNYMRVLPNNIIGGLLPIKQKILTLFFFLFWII